MLILMLIANFAVITRKPKADVVTHSVSLDDHAPWARHDGAPWLLLYVLSIIVCFCQQLHASTPIRSIFDTNQFLSLAPHQTLNIRNVEDSPISISVVLSSTQKCEPGERQSFQAPESKRFAFWYQKDKAGFPIILGGSQTVSLSNHGASSQYTDVSYREIYTLQSGELLALEAPSSYFFRFFRIDGPLDTYSNAYGTPSDAMIVLSSRPQLSWYALRRPHDFMKIPYDYNNPDDPIMPELRDRILPSLGISSNDFYEKIQQSYDGNLPLIQNSELPDVNAVPRIPKVINMIWFSDKDDPKYPPESFYDCLLETMNVCPPPYTESEYGHESGFGYVLWVNSTDVLHFFKSALLFRLGADLVQYIKVKDRSEFERQLVCEEALNAALAVRNWGEASDIFRYEVLRDGGAYIDGCDYKFIRSPALLFYRLDFFSGMEWPHHIAACNAMIAVKPNHPIIHECLRMINQNVNPQTMPKFLRDHEHNWKPHIKTLFKTGPLMFSIAYYNAGTDRDVLFPSTVFFPKHDADPLERKAMACDVLGIHYHTMTWFDHTSALDR